ncbi:MAG: hypothetical protein H6767_03285 [Candidatus Peribacteria bacterium]|nr:MAG: hypothetical protein H6767_03285 [Candidatus Peribacteria bacterium]
MVDDFHPRILEQLDASPDLKSIYQIMLEREFSHWPSHFQYFLLLELSGDYNEWQRKILETI